MIPARKNVLGLVVGLAVLCCLCGSPAYGDPIGIGTGVVTGSWTTGSWNDSGFYGAPYDQIQAYYVGGTGGGFEGAGMINLSPGWVAEISTANLVVIKGPVGTSGPGNWNFDFAGNLNELVQLHWEYYLSANQTFVGAGDFTVGSGGADWQTTTESRGFVDTAAVPLPAAAWGSFAMLGLLGGLGVIRRMRAA